MRDFLKYISCKMWSLIILCYIGILLFTGKIMRVVDVIADCTYEIMKEMFYFVPEEYLVYIFIAIVLVATLSFGCYLKYNEDAELKYHEKVQ